MDHNAVVREKMTERYLLKELDPEVRDEFEQHFFACPECALDVRAGTEFVAESKAVLARNSEPLPARDLAPVKRGLSRRPSSAQERFAQRPSRQSWFFGLRPAFAAPALALLLAVIAYQNLVTLPKLHQPHVLAWAAVNVGTWGAGGPAITLPQGQPFLLFVRIPPAGNYARYVADLYDPAGKLETSLAFPPVVGQDEWPVMVPGARRQAGTYTLTVRGLTVAGESKDLGKTSFELQIQN